MIPGLSRAAEVHLALAIRRYCRQREADGFPPVPGLDELADRLLIPPEHDGMTRRRALWAASSRRYRQRKRQGKRQAQAA